MDYLTNDASTPFPPESGTRMTRGSVLEGTMFYAAVRIVGAVYLLVHMGVGIWLVRSSPRDVFGPTVVFLGPHIIACPIFAWFLLFP